MALMNEDQLNKELEDDVNSFDDLNAEGTDIGQMEEEIVQASAIPEKFKGKTAEEIAASYVNLEKELGRKNNEVGELRRLADDYIKQEITSNRGRKEEVASKKFDVDKFYEDPEAVLSEFIESKLGGTKEQLNNISKATQMEKFESKWPEWRQWAADESFASFVQSSPYRNSLAQKADAMDLIAADELFSIYKDYKEFKGTAVKDEAEQVKKESLKKAASLTGSSGASSTKKKYRRSDLVQLKIQNPAKYESMQDEILLAYSEGRVK